MAFSVHFGCEIAPFLVANLITVGEQGHSLHREGERSLEPFCIEPFHKTFLQPAEAVPVRSASVREAELAEEALEIVFVIVSHIPEHGLEVSGSCRLVD